MNSRTKSQTKKAYWNGDVQKDATNLLNTKKNGMQQQDVGVTGVRKQGRP
jgi:hypothetical protein